MSVIQLEGKEGSETDEKLQGMDHESFTETASKTLQNVELFDLH